MPLQFLEERPLPPIFESLRELAEDLRWSGARSAERLWERIDPELWQRTRNPYLLLQEVSDARLEAASLDQAVIALLQAVQTARKQRLERPGWFGIRHADSDLKQGAYFSLEFGLGEALPIYAGGLGILAGDYLKTAADLGIPLTGLGLLYDQGYFLQQLTPDGRQIEAYPYNDPAGLPVEPVRDADDQWLRVKIELPGREVLLRVWKVRVGCVSLYLLDSNDMLNDPYDRAITDRLYGGDKEHRITQELALGVGGWRLLESLKIAPEICHLNEGHAAFAILSRAIAFMEQYHVRFHEALCATRPGNLFTTHTPVAAGFDKFEPALLARYLQPLADRAKLPVETLLDLGRETPGDSSEVFNMAYLAVRGSGWVNGVSRLHGEVSRPIFSPLYPRWPLGEVPIDHVTNAIHIPTWRSPLAADLWGQGEDDSTASLGPDGSAKTPAQSALAPEKGKGDVLWAYRNTARKEMVDYVRLRLARQMKVRSAPRERLDRVEAVFDPNALTLGFARRFAAYKRPNLLLRDLDRLSALLNNTDRPVQLIVAGKAHPGDESGKHLLQTMAQATERPDLFNRIVFLADYDMTLTSELVAGVDVWLNTPRRPMEASGTSGMKVLANGGLNLSELDGWWAEAYTPEVGWALGDGREHGDDPAWDAHEAEQLYQILEQQVIPEFYTRDAAGLPRAWLQRIRASMTRLTPQYDGERMVREYVEKGYLPGATAYLRRAAEGAKSAVDIQQWRETLDARWHELALTDLQVDHEYSVRTFRVRVQAGSLSPELFRVELYAEATTGDGPVRLVMTPDGAAAPDGSRLYRAQIRGERHDGDYTPRVIPFHPSASIPLEAPHITWLQ